MILFKKIIELQEYLVLKRKTGTLTSFVPTMGALHEGHITLIKEAKKTSGLCVASIFVNPTQFNDPKDFEKYPVTIETDIQKLEAAGCDILFLPSVKEIYPDGVELLKNFNLGYLETVLEGKFRPGHFQGVCMVVHRLLSIVQPDKLYLGQKDYQQCMVITRMIATTDLKGKIEVIISPTVREKDGLAMSSRNARLNSAERERATSIIQTLRFVKMHLRKGSLQHLKKQAVSMLTEKGFRVDYVEIADADSLEIITEWNGQSKLVILTAAFLNEVRLIDNIVIS